MIVGMATAPEVGADPAGTSTRPRLAGCRPRSAPSCSPFVRVASQDFRRYGHSQRLNEYPVKQAQIPPQHGEDPVLQPAQQRLRPATRSPIRR